MLKTGGGGGPAEPMDKMSEKIFNLIPNQFAAIESELDWAHPLSHLALGAFETIANAGLREGDIEQMLYKFSDGCFDREAGLHAFYRHPKSLDQAMAFVEKFQFTHAEMHGPRDSRRPVSTLSQQIGLLNACVDRLADEILSSKTAGHTSSHGGDETPCLEEVHSTQSMMLVRKKPGTGRNQCPFKERRKKGSQLCQKSALSDEK
ncbi:hypothetical protein PoB_005161200 [Plakobranchus ocellatus]|uniref:Uncharacterized protein n=1 Tax=Plakobranchus ocellatus TaxID=259542 RepID=A0AAV4C0J3_9GAST|nr:hypothetical protein PoB_005161200 [Plakobranchus ocellatus]